MAITKIKIISKITKYVQGLDGFGYVLKQRFFYLEDRSVNFPFLQKGAGFNWTDEDKNAPHWTFEECAEGLHHPLAERQFAADLEALK